MDYVLCGLRVRSALPMPELAPWTGGEAGEPDATIEEGSVPERLEGESAGGDYLSVGADGAVLLNIPGLVRLLARGGREIIVDILRRDDPAEAWRLFLLGSGLGHLCHQRGLLPLHAASVEIGARAVAIAGPSGAGKSTLSLALTKRGCALLSDDVTVLRVPGAGRAEILPAYPRLKLWRDSLAAQGVPTELLPRVRAELEKFDLRPRGGFDPAPRPLDAVLILAEGPAPALSRLPPLKAVSHVRENVFRPNVGALLGRKAAIFAQAAAVAGSTPVYRFERPKEFAALSDSVAALEEAFAQ